MPDEREGAVGEGPGDVLVELDESPLTRQHWRIWFLSAMGIFLDGFDFFIIGVAVPLIVHEWEPSSLEIGLISASAVIGAVVGASTLGPLTDKLGRKTAYTVDLLFFIVFAAASALAWGIWPLIAFRFCLGLGIGADYPLSASYVAEVVPGRFRGKMLVGAFSFQAVGQLFGAVVGVVILNVWPDPNAWRVMFLIGIVPAIVIAIARFGVPESPRWLLANGFYEKAAVVVGSLLGRKVTAAEMEAVHVPSRVRYRELFGRAFRRRTVLTTVPWFLMDIATYGVGVFTPTIIAAILVTNESSFIASDITSTEGAALVDLFLVIGFGLALLLIDRVGRIKLQVGGFLAMAFGLVVLALSSALGGPDEEHLVLVFAGFIVFNLFMNMGPNSTTYTLPAEVFPTQLRASAAGLAASCGKLGAAVGLVLFPIMQDGFGLAWTLIVIATGCVMAAVITFACRVETAHRSTADLDRIALPAPTPALT